MMASETPTRILRGEHERILRVLKAFEKTVERTAAGEGEWERVADFLRFFRLFVGGCHHGKEEELLFPALEERGFSRRDGPLAVMLEDHRRGLHLVSEMARALPGAREGRAAASSTLADTAREYVSLIRRHIGKENPAVFDAADRLLAGPPCRRLCEAYGSADATGFEGRSADDLERLADRLVDPRAEAR